MKALTLWNPWATLVALGEKRIETRSWRTDYRGPLAIHASARARPNWKLLEELGGLAEARDVLRAHGFVSDDELPRGAIVATCELVDIVLARTAALEITQGINLPNADPAEFELKFGDYRVTSKRPRWAWLLARVVRLEKPIPAAGRMGLWDFPWPVVSHA